MTESAIGVLCVGFSVFSSVWLSRRRIVGAIVVRLGLALRFPFTFVVLLVVRTLPLDTILKSITNDWGHLFAPIYNFLWCKFLCKMQLHGFCNDMQNWILRKIMQIMQICARINNRNFHCKLNACDQSQTYHDYLSCIKMKWSSKRGND